MSAMTANAIWHDVECGAYAADLPFWEELAERQGGTVLELGCGTGRVALHLARRGYEVVGLDADAELLAVLDRRGAELPVNTLHADARDFALDESTTLVLAPTHLLQLLDGAGARAESLHCIAAALRPGGLLAASIIEAMPEPDGSPPPLPDVREVDGWVYSSLATEVAVGPEELLVRRLRQTVSPEGSLSEEPNEVRIATFAAETLESEAAAFGLVPAGRYEIPPTDLHVGSLVVLLERSG
ncbi:MAG TPA: class I SAM-dependent methyltransferase [Solirubrobacterales bacterium]|jgi:SAM-dependent methyltransferase|nr:class I SAM-dependent methyltransferase [Solirubrobacterales bacterium]